MPVQRWRWRGLAVAMAVVLALAGCGGGEPAASSPSPTVEPLLAFSAVTLDGKPFDGNSLAGKPTVLWFWAPWCPVCLGQASGVRQAAERYAGQVNIVGVAGLDTAAAMPEFVRLAKVEGVPHLVDENGDVWKRFGIRAQSTFVLLDSTGTVTFRGTLSGNEVADRVATLLR